MEKKEINICDTLLIIGMDITCDYDHCDCKKMVKMVSYEDYKKAKQEGREEEREEWLSKIEDFEEDIDKEITESNINFPFIKYMIYKLKTQKED